MDFFIFSLFFLYLLSEIMPIIETERECLWCHKEILEDSRYDRKFCSKNCKDSAHKCEC